MKARFLVSFISLFQIFSLPLWADSPLPVCQPVDENPVITEILGSAGESDAQPVERETAGNFEQAHQEVAALAESFFSFENLTTDAQSHQLQSLLESWQAQGANVEDLARTWLLVRAQKSQEYLFNWFAENPNADLRALLTSGFENLFSEDDLTRWWVRNQASETLVNLSSLADTYGRLITDDLSTIIDGRNDPALLNDIRSEFVQKRDKFYAELRALNEISPGAIDLEQVDQSVRLEMRRARLSEFFRHNDGKTVEDLEAAGLAGLVDNEEAQLIRHAESSRRTQRSLDYALQRLERALQSAAQSIGRSRAMAGWGTNPADLPKIEANAIENFDRELEVVMERLRLASELHPEIIQIDEENMRSQLLEEVQKRARILEAQHRLDRSIERGSSAEDVFENFSDVLSQEQMQTYLAARISENIIQGVRERMQEIAESMFAGAMSSGVGVFDVQYNAPQPEELRRRAYAQIEAAAEELRELNQSYPVAEVDVDAFVESAKEQFERMVQIKLAENSALLRLWTDIRTDLEASGLFDEAGIQAVADRVAQIKMKPHLERIAQASAEVGHYAAIKNLPEDQHELFVQANRNRHAAFQEIKAIVEETGANIDLEEIINWYSDIAKQAGDRVREWQAANPPEPQEPDAWYKTVLKAFPKTGEALLNLTVGNIAYYGGGVLSFVQGEGWSGSQAGADFINWTRGIGNEHWGGSILGTDEELAEMSLLEAGLANNPLGQLGGGVIGGSMQGLNELYMDYAQWASGYSDEEFAWARENDGFIVWGERFFNGAQLAAGAALVLSTGNTSGVRAQLTRLGVVGGSATGMSAAAAIGEELFVASQEGRDFSFLSAAERTYQSTAGSLLFMGGISALSKLHFLRLAKSATQGLTPGTPAYTAAMNRAMVTAQTTARTVDLAEGLSDLQGSVAMMADASNLQEIIGSSLRMGSTIYDSADVSVSGALNHLRPGRNQDGQSPPAPEAPSRPSSPQGPSDSVETGPSQGSGVRQAIDSVASLSATSNAPSAQQLRQHLEAQVQQLEARSEEVVAQEQKLAATEAQIKAQKERLMDTALAQERQRLGLSENDKLEPRQQGQVARQVQASDAYKALVAQQQAATVSYLHFLNQQIPSDLRIDFSSVEQIALTMARAQSLVGIDVSSAEELLAMDQTQVPDRLVRRDFSPNSSENPVTQTRKPHVSDVGLEPANIRGNRRPSEHISRSNDTQVKKDSPFTSFSNPHQLPEGQENGVDRFGNYLIELRLRDLLQAIADGRVSGVDVLTRDQILVDGINQLRRHKSITKMSEQNRQRANDLIDALESKIRSGELVTSDDFMEFRQSIYELGAPDTQDFRHVLNQLRHAIENAEYLIRGTVPSEFFTVSEVPVDYSYSDQESKVIAAELDRPDISGSELVAVLADGNSAISSLYHQSAGVRENITVGVHTQTVIDQYQEIIGSEGKQDFAGIQAERFHQLMLATLALHDIGKPFAVAAGNKDAQHEFSTPIVKEVLAELGFSAREIQVAEALVDHDILGRMINPRATDPMSVDQAAQAIESMAADLGVKAKDLFRVMSVFYRADTSSYEYLRSKIFKEGSLEISNERFIELSERINQTPQEQNLTAFQRRFLRDPVGLHTSRDLLMYDQVTPANSTAEQRNFMAAYNLGMEELSAAQKQSLQEAYEYGRSQKNEIGRLPYQAYSWSREQVEAKVEILSAAFSENQIDGALRAIGVHPSSGAQLASARLEGILLTKEGFSDQTMVEENKLRRPQDKRPPNQNIYLIQTDQGDFHAQVTESDFNSFSGSYLEGEIKFVGSADFVSRGNGRFKYKIEPGYDQGPDTMRIQNYDEFNPGQGPSGAFKLFLETAIRLHPKVEQFEIRAHPNRGFTNELVALLRENPQPSLSELQGVSSLFSLEGYEFSIEMDEYRGQAFPKIRFKKISGEESRLVDVDKIFSSEDGQEILAQGLPILEPEPQDRGIAYPGTSDTSNLPTSYDFNLTEHSQSKQRVSELLNDSELQSYETQLSEMMSDALEIMRDDKRDSANQSLESRINNLTAMDGTSAAYYQTLFFGKAVDPSFEAQVMEGLTRRADAIYFESGGAFDSNGNFRSTQAYDQAFIQAQDEALARAGIRALDSSRLNDPEYVKANIPESLLQRFNERWLIREGVDPENSEFRGSISGREFALLLSGGFALREHGLAYHSPSRFGESGPGGHGRDYHLLQIIVAMEAIDSTYGEGTFAQVYREEFSYYYGAMWVAGFEGGTDRFGASMLMPMIRVYGQNPQTDENGRPVRDPEGPPGRVLVEGPPALPYIQ